MSAMMKVEVPSKWDIIPIHTSDRATFKRCRRQWNWSSPARQNLTRKISVHGIYPPFWFGTGIHYAVQKFYDPEFTEDATVAFETWFNLQVHGGMVTDDELTEFKDNDPIDKGDGIWYVRGLDELISDYDPDQFEELRKMGVGMMNYYKDYAGYNDNFTVVAVEQTFSVPVLDDDGNAIYMLDTRNMPYDWEPSLGHINQYGPLMRMVQAKDQSNVHPGDGPLLDVEKQVHARGRIDMIMQDNESGRYGISDYKTASKIDDDYFRHLDLDEQVTTYSWAAEVMAQIYDLPYTSIDFIVYQAMLKAYPKPPTVNKRGFPLSLNRSEESTTAEMFAEAVEILGIRKLFEADEKAQSYYTWLLESQEKRFINRHTVRRNKFQKYNCGRRLYLECMDMLDGDLRIYPNPTKDYSCLNCIFRSPCVMMEDGGDPNSLIEDGFQMNYDR